MLRLFILNPLIINLLIIFIVYSTTQLILKFLRSLTYRSTDIYQYKIYSKFLSLLLVSSYINIFIIGLYLLRLYNIPRELNLMLVFTKIYHIFYIVQTLTINIPLTYKMFLACMLMLSIIIIMLGIKKFHQIVFKEIYKVFLYVSSRDSPYRKYINKIIHELSFIGNTDLITHFIDHYLFIFIKKYKGQGFNPHDVPKYTVIKIKHVIFSSSIYKYILLLSPFLVIIYDCIYNNFVVTNVFYYLLFYVPLMLLKRITAAIGLHAPYFFDYLWRIYYIKEDCIYVTSPVIKAIIDNYILSELTQNFQFNSSLDVEILIQDVTRFEPMRSNRSFYKNIEGEIVYTRDNIRFYHMVEDEDGNLREDQEWFLLVDKRRNNINYDKER